MYIRLGVVERADIAWGDGGLKSTRFSFPDFVMSDNTDPARRVSEVPFLELRWVLWGDTEEEKKRNK